MFIKYFNRIPCIALFIFVMMSLVINHHNTYGQIPTPIPTPDLSPIPEPTGPETGVVTGTVVNAADGTAIAGAVVSTDTGASTTTDPTGSYVLELPPGNYLLTASATGFISSSQPVEVIAGVPTSANFALQPGTTGGSGIVFGFVNDPDENPLKGVTVTITDTEFSDSTETDEDGFYTFENLAAGDYTLTYEKEGFQTQTQDISLGENEPPKDLGTVVMEEVVRAKISGYVVDIGGGPIENVKIRVKGLTTGYKNTTASDADGYFEVDDLEADTYVLIAKKRGFKRAKQTITLEEGDETEIEIEMKRTSRRIIKASAR